MLTLIWYLIDLKWLSFVDIFFQLKALIWNNFLIMKRFFLDYKIIKLILFIIFKKLNLLISFLILQNFISLFSRFSSLSNELFCQLSLCRANTWIDICNKFDWANTQQFHASNKAESNHLFDLLQYYDQERLFFKEKLIKNWSFNFFPNIIYQSTQSNFKYDWK